MDASGSGGLVGPFQGPGIRGIVPWVFTHGYSRSTPSGSRKPTRVGRGPCWTFPGAADPWGRTVGFHPRLLLSSQNCIWGRDCLRSYASWLLRLCFDSTHYTLTRRKRMKQSFRDKCVPKSNLGTRVERGETQRMDLPGNGGRRHKRRRSEEVAGDACVVGSFQGPQFAGLYRGYPPSAIHV